MITELLYTPRPKIRKSGYSTFESIFILAFHYPKIGKLSLYSTELNRIQDMGWQRVHFPCQAIFWVSEWQSSGKTDLEQYIQVPISISYSLVMVITILCISNFFQSKLIEMIFTFKLQVWLIQAYWNNTKTSIACKEDTVLLNAKTGFARDYLHLLKKDFLWDVFKLIVTFNYQ